MAKTGGWFKKLRDKQRKQATETKLGKQRAVITRVASTHADKRVSFEAHKRSIHGLEVHGRVVDSGGRNPQPVLTNIKRDGSVKAVCFHGDGLVDDSLSTLKAPKTNAERAAADKRNSIASEAKPEWKPRGFAQRKYGRQSGCYLAR